MYELRRPGHVRCMGVPLDPTPSCLLALRLNLSCLRYIFQTYRRQLVLPLDHIGHTHTRIQMEKVEATLLRGDCQARLPAI